MAVLGDSWTSPSSTSRTTGELTRRPPTLTLVGAGVVKKDYFVTKSHFVIVQGTSQFHDSNGQEFIYLLYHNTETRRLIIY